MRGHPYAFVVALTAVALAGTGCIGISSGENASDRPPVASSGSAQPPPTTDPGCRFLIASTTRRSTPAPPIQDLVLLTDAVATPDTCYDKLTFTFRPTGHVVPPGYDAAYLDDGPATELNERGVQVNSPHVSGGNASLIVTFQPAQSRDKSKANQPLTYTGSLNLNLQGLEHVLLVHKHLVDGEDSVTWLIELDTKRPFIVDSYVSGSTPKINVLIMH